MECTVTFFHCTTDLTMVDVFCSGLIDVDQSVAGMIEVLESDLPLAGHW